MSVVSAVSTRRTIPYISIDQFKNHSRAGVQVENLVPKGDAAQQDAALASYIEQATAWIDTQTEGLGFAAQLDTVLAQVNISRQGYATLQPPRVPCIALTEFSAGPSPALMQPISSLAGAAVFRTQIKVPVYPLALTSSAGPIQFGGISAPADQAFVRYRYCGGYPVTWLTAGVAAGSNVALPVADTTGIIEGKTWLTVYALERRFSFLAGVVSTADANGFGTGPGTVICATVPYAISNSMNYPVYVSALVPDLVLATVLATRGFIKQKGSGSVTTTSSTGRTSKQGAKNAGDDLAQAWEVLAKHLHPVGDDQ